MGCGSSNIDSEVPKSWMDLFAAMRLTRNEVIQLHNLFKKVDFDKSGTVDIVELLTLLNVERTRFTEQLFKVFDSDGSGKIDFKEFVLSVWNYCTISPSSLDMFTFDMYDNDKSGKLSFDEIMVMVADLYGKSHMNDPKVKAMKVELHKIDDDGDGISIEALKTFGKHHQALLYPVFKLQHHMQESVLGTGFWHKASDRRVELSKGKYVTMGDLLNLHMNPELYRKVLADSGKVNPKVALLAKHAGPAHHRHKHDPNNVGPPPMDDHIPSQPGILPHFDDGHHGHGHHNNHGHGHGRQDGHYAHGRHSPQPGHSPPPSNHGHGSHNHSSNQSANHSAEHSSGYDDDHNSSLPNLAPNHHHAHNSSHGSMGHNSHNSGHGSGHGSQGSHGSHSGHGSSHHKDHKDHKGGHNHHHGAVLKHTAADDGHHNSKKPTHATGHHYSDGRVHAGH